MKTETLKAIQDLDGVLNPTDLGVFRGQNNPIDILHANRAENWRDTTWFLVACCILTFGWLVWEWVR